MTLKVGVWTSHKFNCSPNKHQFVYSNLLNVHPSHIIPSWHVSHRIKIFHNIHHLIYDLETPHLLPWIPTLHLRLTVRWRIRWNRDSKNESFESTSCAKFSQNPQQPCRWNLAKTVNIEELFLGKTKPIKTGNERKKSLPFLRYICIKQCWYPILWVCSDIREVAGRESRAMVRLKTCVCFSRERGMEVIITSMKQLVKWMPNFYIPTATYNEGSSSSCTKFREVFITSFPLSLVSYTFSLMYSIDLLTFVLVIGHTINYK